MGEVDEEDFGRRSSYGTQGGLPLSHRTELRRNLDRVIYRLEENGDATYMGTLSHAGTLEREMFGKFIHTSQR